MKSILPSQRFLVDYRNLANTISSALSEMEFTSSLMKEKLISKKNTTLKENATSMVADLPTEKMVLMRLTVLESTADDVALNHVTQARQMDGPAR